MQNLENLGQLKLVFELSRSEQFNNHVFNIASKDNFLKFINSSLSKIELLDSFLLNEKEDGLYFLDKSSITSSTLTNSLDGIDLILIKSTNNIIEMFIVSFASQDKSKSKLPVIKNALVEITKALNQNLRCYINYLILLS